MSESNGTIGMLQGTGGSRDVTLEGRTPPPAVGAKIPATIIARDLRPGKDGTIRVEAVATVVTPRRHTTPENPNAYWVDHDLTLDVEGCPNLLPGYWPGNGYPAVVDLLRRAYRDDVELRAWLEQHAGIA